MANSSAPKSYRAIGIGLAVCSGLFIGSSFVLKKKGLLRSQKGKVAGEGVAYLKSPLWWTGMTMMIFGELLNLGAYSFVEAIIVTPLGALSVVICAILSHFILKEKLSLFGWIGCFQCIMGSIIIAMNAPNEQSVTTIAAFKHYFLAPWFLAYGSLVLAAAFGIIFLIAPKYGSKSMIWYILVCSLFGGLSVSCTQALGACIVTSIRGENQFKNWFIYFLLGFVVCTLLSEIFFLNKALAQFNTAMVTPTYYVTFTFLTLVTSVILYEGLKSSGAQIMTMVLAFFVICSGIFILQMSKVDPKKLNPAVVDRRTTMLLEAARQEIRADREREKREGEGSRTDDEDEDIEKLVEGTEEPGIDALRGSMGLGAMGSIVRARRRQTIRDKAASLKSSRSQAHIQSAFSVDSNSNSAEKNGGHMILVERPGIEPLIDSSDLRSIKSQVLFASPLTTPDVRSAPKRTGYFFNRRDRQEGKQPPAVSTNAAMSTADPRDTQKEATPADPNTPQVPMLTLPDPTLTIPTPFREDPPILSGMPQLPRNESIPQKESTVDLATGEVH